MLPFHSHSFLCLTIFWGVCDWNDVHFDVFTVSIEQKLTKLEGGDQPAPMANQPRSPLITHAWHGVTQGARVENHGGINFGMQCGSEIYPISIVWLGKFSMMYRLPLKQ